MSFEISDPIPVTIISTGMPFKYSLTFNKNSIFLRRGVESHAPPYHKTTQISISRNNISSMRLEAGPDFRAASLLGIFGGVTCGIAGIYLGSTISGTQTGGPIGGFVGLLTGFAGGFAISLNKFRIGTLQLKMPSESYTMWINPNNIPTLQNILQ